MKKYIYPPLKMVGLLIIWNIISTIFNRILTLPFKSRFEIISAMSTLLASALTVFIFIKITKTNLTSIGIKVDKSNKQDFLKGIKKGLVYSVMVTLFLLISMEAVISTRPKYYKALFASVILGIISSFIFACVEEIIYRGCIFNYLKGKYTFGGSVIISSFLYALTYEINLYTTPISILNNFLIGCILTVIFLKSDNLIEVIGIHFSWYVIIYYVFSFPSHGKINSGILNFNFKNMELLNGGTYGVEGGIIFTVCAALFILYLYKRKIKEKLTINKKSRAAVSVLMISVLCYIVYDIAVWYPGYKKFSTTPIKSVSKFKDVNNYNMTWDVDVNNRRIFGVEDVEYINTSHSNLSEIYFHMYAAAFKKYGGDIKIQDVEVNGKKNKFDIQGKDGTLLHIKLPSIIGFKNRADIDIKYTIDIPKRSSDGFADRFSYSPNAINLGNCFPIAAVYENGSWDKHPYDEKGDAFYSETSNFSVNVTVPKDYTLAVTGVVNKIETTPLKNKKWYITANGVRDFALVASDKFKEADGNIDGTMIKSYAFNKLKAKKALDISADSISIFNRRFGEYPYGTCSVVETDLNGGMEYPTMVMILSKDYTNMNLMNVASDIFYGRPLGDFESVIAHELAHQWWYGLVGNDEYRESWIDEPLAQFSTLLYFKDKYGEKTFQSVYDRTIAYGYNRKKLLLKNTSFKRPLNQFKDEIEYNELIYNGVPIKIMKYYKSVGDSKFNSVLKEIFKKYEFKILHGNNYPIPL